MRWYGNFCVLFLSLSGISNAAPVSPLEALANECERQRSDPSSDARLILAAQDRTRYIEMFREVLDRGPANLYELRRPTKHFVPEEIREDLPRHWARYFSGGSPSVDAKGIENFSFRWGALTPASQRTNIVFRPTANGEYVPLEKSHYIQADLGGPPIAEKPVKVYLTLPPVFVKKNLQSIIERSQKAGAKALKIAVTDMTRPERVVIYFDPAKANAAIAFAEQLARELPQNMGDPLPFTYPICRPPSNCSVYLAQDMRTTSWRDGITSLLAVLSHEHRAEIEAGQIGPVIRHIRDLGIDPEMWLQNDLAQMVKARLK